MNHGTADQEAAIALCRMDNQGQCSCEKTGRGVFCARYLREISELRQDYLDPMRCAIAAGSRRDDCASE